MKTKCSLKGVGILFTIPALIATFTFAGTKDSGEAKGPYHPKIDPSNFSNVVDNPYFPLVPGTIRIFRERDGDDTAESKVTVTHDTKVIMGVKCVVVHDVVTEEGELEEDTYDWYAQDKQGTVWYFGETTREMKGGGRVSSEAHGKRESTASPASSCKRIPSQVRPTARSFRPRTPKIWVR